MPPMHGARHFGELLPELTRCSFAARSPTHRDTIDRLERARRRIEQAPGQIHDLDSLAGAACLSPHHFARLFRELYGVPPHRYLTERRLERARTLLRSEGASVTDTCFAVGFSSLGSFSRLFKRHVGEPPSRYRRRWVQVAWEPPPPIPVCFRRRFFGLAT